MSVMTTSADGRAFIKRFEGCILWAYDDADASRRFIQFDTDEVKGTLTIGVGHTRTVRPGMRITELEADKLLGGDLMAAESAVEAMIEPPMKQHEFDALVSFVYNIGSGQFERSSVRRLINGGQKPLAATKFALFNKTRIGGDLVVSTGLAKRRRAESELFTHADYGGKP